MHFCRKISVYIAVLILLTVKAGAQLCQGSLGDPIVNTTFGAGPNPGASLAAATTNYQYVSGDCPGDGYYTVRNNTTACFGNTWHSLTADHTGNANGYFMLVNASVQPGIFYLDTVRGLCSNTTFEFAAWVMNVILPSACNANSNQPNLTFSIERTDGTLLQSYNTSNIPPLSSPVWKQFGFFFTTPAGVSDIVLKIVNNAAGGCGNDLALDDITFRPCGPKLIPAITGNVNSTASLCKGTAGLYNFTCTVSAGFNNPSFQWQQSINGGGWTDVPGQTTTSLTQNFPATAAIGTYHYRLAAAEAGNMASPQCRVVSDIITIKVNDNPVTTTTNNSPVCEQATGMLSANGGTQYNWTGVNNFSATGPDISLVNIQQAQAGKYYVRVTDANNCFSIDSATITVNPKPVVSTNITATDICEGENIQLSASGGNNYIWSPVTTLSSSVIANPVATPITSTDYTVIVSNPFNCADTAIVSIHVNKKPTADAGPDKTIVKDSPVQLNGSVSGDNISFSWQPSPYINNTQILQPVVTPPGDTTFILSVVSTIGCGTASDTVNVFVYKGVHVPTAFSPNGDGLNDTWYVPALSAYPKFSVTVFNRDGQIVFQTKDINKPWDGKYKGQLQPNGTYVYVIDLKLGGDVLKGTVLLLR